MQQDFDVALEVLPEGVVVLRVHGDLDMATAPRVEEALTDVGVPRTLVVDLRDCAFLDSAAVRLLSETAEELEDAGGRLKLVATDPGVLRVLEITALDTRLPVHSNLESALA